MDYERSFEAGDREIADVADREVVKEYDDVQDEDGLRRGKRRLIVISAVVAALVILVAAIVMMRAGGSDGDAGANQFPVVSVLVPGKLSVAGEINATGTLSARRPMPVGSVGEGGEVREVRVDAGDWVRQGQVLAVVDRSVQSQQAASMAAQVEVARADAQLAEANLQRALQLVDRGFISKADVDRLTATRDAAMARVRVAEAQLSEMRARNARLNIVAPAGGLVLERNVEQGQVVGGASGPLFVLARGGEMELAAKVSENDLSRIAVGVNADVTPVGSQKTFTGQIWQVSPTIEETTRQGFARIALPYDRALRPGGFASVRIMAGTSIAPILPESAIMSDARGSYVYVVGPDNKVARRDVKTGLVTEQGIAIAGGLDGTERVVLRAGGFLNPGDPIRPEVVKQAALR